MPPKRSHSVRIDVSATVSFVLAKKRPVASAKRLFFLAKAPDAGSVCTNIYRTATERLNLADSRSPGNSAERLLWRKLPPEKNISEAIADPFETFVWYFQPN